MIKSVIDIGTNSTRLLTGKITDGSYVELVRLTRITRLGENLSATGEISKEAAKRTAFTIKEYLEISREKGADKVSAFATFALRNSKNSEEVLAFFKEATGLEVKVISGEEEAFFSFKGATIDFGSGNKMVVDIGGGSTEIAFGSESPKEVKSMSMGCVTLTEDFELDKASDEAKVRKVIDFVKDNLSKEFSKKELSNFPSIFVGGTATSIAAVLLGLETYDRNAVHLSSFSQEDLMQIAFEISSLSAAQRAKFKVIEKERLPVIAAGAVILVGIVEFFGLRRIYVSEKDILDGYLIFGS